MSDLKKMLRILIADKAKVLNEWIRPMGTDEEAFDGYLLGLLDTFSTGSTIPSRRRVLRHSYARTHTKKFLLCTVRTNGNWQWCGREVGPFKRAASCAVPSDPNGWSSDRSGGTWTAWPLCVCGSGGSARRSVRNATRILPKNICMASLLKQKENS